MDVCPLEQDELERLREDLIESSGEQSVPEQYQSWEFMARLLATVDLSHQQRREMAHRIEELACRTA